ncbi:oocyte zinc finger protein XlCOF7.1-like [Syngnathoides biaculeatus]|uniref:oocyte zinc finger protein XlCOF7.1-like n=1 Tax=Syngnathoides biaculeatus TaxID=300417 RepID=UPI002ADE8A59|nr:oocyte zinc finger protein XlCOF7.1-like [Syngnathoides biaculeatus]
MCKVEILRALLNQRLSAAVEEVFGVFARTIAEYEEKLCRTKEENERQRQLLDALLKHHVAFRNADTREEDLHPEHRRRSFTLEQQQPEPPNVKEEGPLYVKEEKEQADVANLPLTDALASLENDDAGPEPPGGCSSRHGTTKGDADRRGRSQEDRLFAPLSESDNAASRSPDPDDDDDRPQGPSDSARLKCSQCDKSFINAASLKRHATIHKGDKTFNCSFCGKRFNQKVHLIKHTRTHTGEKPFSCTVCGMKLSQKEYLKVHMRTHTGEKPFPCSVCGKRFSQKAFLKVHTRTHTGEKPFSCLVCNKSFSAYSTCTRHQRTHTGDKVFSCSVCEKKFTRKDNLNKHKCTGKK